MSFDRPKSLENKIVVGKIEKQSDLEFVLNYPKDKALPFEIICNLTVQSLDVINYRHKLIQENLFSSSARESHPQTLFNNNLLSIIALMRLECVHFYQITDYLYNLKFYLYRYIDLFPELRKVLLKIKLFIKNTFKEDIEPEIMFRSLPKYIFNDSSYTFFDIVNSYWKIISNSERINEDHKLSQLRVLYFSTKALDFTPHNQARIKNGLRVKS